jgi:hypothetical protein
LPRIFEKFCARQKVFFLFQKFENQFFKQITDLTIQQITNLVWAFFSKTGLMFAKAVSAQRL